MIKIGLEISEIEYRELNYPSYSLLSNIKKEGAFAVNTEKLDISDKDGIIIGSMVDSIITDGKVPDNLLILPKKPTGKPLDIIKNLSNRDDLEDDTDLLSSVNNRIIEEELNNQEYYSAKSFNFRRNKLKVYKSYANALVTDKTTTIVSQYQYNTAISISNNITLKYPFLQEEDNIAFQVKVIGEVHGVKIKGMLDFLYIDHDSKLIMPYDLKTGAKPHYTFFEGGYLGWNYYLQASLYKELLEQEIRKTHPEYNEYKMDNFRFMYCGRADKLPIIYKVTDKWHDAGYKGFEYKGIRFPGINELIDDFIYYEQNPNALYKRGYHMDEVIFDDSML